jgi:AraC-like DNA-binding protein
MIIANWPKIVQKDLTNFFEFPYLFNSPQLMLESIIKSPITKHILLKQSVCLNTTLCKAKIRYRKIEEGLWLFATEMDVSDNIMAKSVYDKNQSSDYYLLTFSVFEYKFTFKDLEDITLRSTCWTFSKPKTEVTTYFYKGTTGKFFSFAINKEWVNKNFSSEKFPQKQAVENFLNGKKGSYTWLDIAPKAHDLMKKIDKTLEAKSDVLHDAVVFKKDCLKLIVEFFDNSFGDNRILDNVSLKNLDYYKIAKAEKMILDNLHLPFIGIEYIAKELKISPTKLKSNFKEVFGFSMLQYYKEKNLLRAIQLIQNSDIHIRNIAKVTGYTNASKFATNFKKRFGELPYKARCLGIS